MSASPVLSIVVAVQHAAENLPAVLAALRPAAQPAVEILVCYDPAVEPTVPALAAGQRVVAGVPGSLIPHLWRDGIRAARGERVATTTAHCIPAADWVERLLAADLADPTVAVGGVIANDSASDALGWAAYMLRYAAFAPGRAGAEDVHELAADNALYRRAELLRHADLLAGGFWEPSFHARFRAAGLRLRFDPELRVVHRNRYTPAQFAAQRLAHGREFGLARAGRLGRPARLLLTLAAPGVPLVLLRRIIRNARARPELATQLGRAMPWLAAFVMSWSAGEARGYAASLLGAGEGRLQS